MKAKDEREAAALQDATLTFMDIYHHGEKDVPVIEVAAVEHGFKAGLAARPEPPEPDRDLVEAASRWWWADRQTGWGKPSPGREAWNNKLVAAFAQEYAATVAARADGPPAETARDVGVAGERQRIKRELMAIINAPADTGSYSLNVVSNLIKYIDSFESPKIAARADAPADVCGHGPTFRPDCMVCYEKGRTQFTPAPTSPERRSEVSGEQINALRHAAADAERERIAAELRAELRKGGDASSMVERIADYIDKLEGKQ